MRWVLVKIVLPNAIVGDLLRPEHFADLRIHSVQLCARLGERLAPTGQGGHGRGPKGTAFQDAAVDLQHSPQRSPGSLIQHKKRIGGLDEDGWFGRAEALGEIDAPAYFVRDVQRLAVKGRSGANPISAFLGEKGNGYFAGPRGPPPLLARLVVQGSNNVCLHRDDRAWEAFVQVNAP